MHDTRRLSDGVTRLMPGVRLLTTYRRAWLLPDLLAGLTVAAILIPQGMAYGSLAGVAPVAGLYAAIAALVAYTLFGSSRQLMVGPESGVAILAAAAIVPLAAGGGAARYAALIAALSILVGCLLILGSVVHAGVLADFLSKPILIGFTNGVALTVIASQLGKLFGIKISGDTFVPTMRELVTHLDETNWLTLAIGVTLIVFLLLARRFLPRVPGALIAVVVTTTVSAAFGLQQHRVAVVGTVPAGLPSPMLPAVGLRDLYNLIPLACSLALVVFADGILTARLFARKHRYPIDADQEMVGLGTASIAAGFLQGFPVGASNSRTVVNDDADGKSQVVGLVTAALVAVFLLLLTPLLAQLPVVTLGAIVIVAAWGLLDFGAIARLYRVLKVDAILASLTFVAVLTLGILDGILFAVGASLLVVIGRITHPHAAVLGSVEGVDGFQEIEPHTSGQLIPGLIVYRFDAPFFFANANHLVDEVQGLVRTSQPGLRWVLLDAEGMVNGDTTAVDALKALADDLQGEGIVLAVARASSPLVETLDRGRVVGQIGPDRFFPTVRTGVQAYLLEHGKEVGDEGQRRAVVAETGKTPKEE